jgi:hypothetical protein
MFARTLPTPYYPTSATPPMSEWSRPLWYTMRVAALQIDRRGRSEEARADFRNLVLAMRTAVPCGECEGHWRADVLGTVKITEADCASSAAASRWLERVHRRIMARKAREARARSDAKTASKTASKTALATGAARAARAAPKTAHATGAARAARVAPKARAARAQAVEGPPTHPAFAARAARGRPAGPASPRALRVAKSTR